MPPLPFLARLPGIETDGLAVCYTDPSVWDAFDPSLMTLCSADPQAFRPHPDAPHVLQVGLATNFKVAPFCGAEHTALLRGIEADIEAVRLDTDEGKLELPVKLRVRDSVFAPLAKWSMLLAGNYACVEAEGVRSIREAVHSDVGRARQVYEWVNELCHVLGAATEDLVPFHRYLSAAESLTEPSSAARAIEAGARRIERTDCLVRALGAQKGMRSEAVDRIVRTVDRRLEANRAAAT